MPWQGSVGGVPEPYPDLLTEPLPTELWIELTSKCPFDCVFCSRKLRRGEGRHMDFAVYRSLIGQLRFPEVIRLNYSGESIHYPHLLEAVALAKAAGARTELVSAFASVPSELLPELAQSGLDRLSVSLHTLEEEQFREIYDYGSLEQMKARLGEFRRLTRERPSAPALDFAFVAMERNLDQLEPVTAYARALGVRQIFLCPVIRRDTLPAGFDAELDSENRLTELFKARVRAQVEHARRQHPEIELIVANPEVEGAGALPEGGRIRSCDQNPWSTVHVLADGAVVVCEVHDRLPMGNLTSRPLAEIWHGEGYREFRRRYQSGTIPECRQCPWKLAYLPGPLRSSIAAQDGACAQLLAGWHPGPDPGVVWSRLESSAVLKRPAGARRLRVRGMLPPGRHVLEVFANGERVGSVTHAGEALQEFDRTFRVPGPGRDPWVIRFRAREAYCPAREGAGTDARRLGFALLEAAAEAPARRWRGRLKPLAILPPFAALAVVDLLCRGLRRWVPRRRAALRPFEPGLSVVIPERDNPELLARCLSGLEAATRRVTEPVEVIAVVNGPPPEHYAKLCERFPHVRWLWFSAPLGFSRAVQEGLRRAAYDWVYLLNNDMTLHPDALAELLPLRASDVFAVASQILPLSSGGRREESNWTDWRFPDGVVEIFDAPPELDAGVGASLYAGGGSSLFRRFLLEELVFRAGDAYDPFYWEDVEWGVVARKLGYRVLFCPASKAFHAHRATIAKHYAPEEIERIFRRNGHLFQMRNVTDLGSLWKLARKVATADRRTVLELLRPRTVWGALLARAHCHFLALDDRHLAGVRRLAGVADGRCTIAP